MNHATRFTKLALLLIVAGALALAGCGGDDGVDESVHDQTVQELETERQARMDAEARADDAETETETERQARMDAETRAEEAEADDETDADAVEQAEQDRMEAEQARMEAEQERMEAEQAAADALKAEQDKASAAMDAAKMASDAAKMASDEAAMATMNLATMQTGAMSATHAYNAKKYADMAMAEYMKAKTASDAAMDAEDTATAALEAAAAEAAQIAAQAAAEMVANADMDGYADKAKAAAMMELMIDGTVKSVGETTIDAMAPKTEVTSGSGADAQTTITGLVGAPMTTGATTDGRAELDADITANPQVSYVSPKVNAAERPLEIGKDVDSADDAARLRIVTAYADMQEVNVYDAASAIGHRSIKEGTVIVDSTGNVIAADGDFDATTNVSLTLRPVGMFYEAAGGSLAGTLEPLAPNEAGEQQGDTVATAIKPRQVYSFVNTPDTTNNSPTVYVVLSETTVTSPSGGDPTTLYEYSIVDIHQAVNQDGRDTGNADGDEAVLVTADLPVPKPYSHLHFGVWASLGEADKDGAQEIADLGIGFVQNISGGMTENMPVLGELTHEGNWVATVQEQNEGAIELRTGEAMLTADIDEDTLKAVLTGLATLDGDLTGNTFSGTKATVDANNAFGLNANGTFTGEFSGGYYGDKGAEVGGIFDFTSEGIADGAFRGALGGKVDAD